MTCTENQTDQKASCSTPWRNTHSSEPPENKDRGEKLIELFTSLKYHISYTYFQREYYTWVSRVILQPRKKRSACSWREMPHVLIFFKAHMIFPLIEPDKEL